MLKNIKSKYILKQIFSLLNEYINLKLLNYNRKLQEKLEIDINDYISYNLIKIELIVNPLEYEKEKFINIQLKNEKNYDFNFYDEADNKIERQKKNFIYGLLFGEDYDTIDKKDNIHKILVCINNKIKDINGLFQKIGCLKEINFLNCKRLNLFNLEKLFLNCNNLIKLNLANMETKNILNMSKIFAGCKLLEEIDLSNFNTKNVINMSWMFHGCSHLKKLNLSNFDTSKVIDMSYMFFECSNLSSLDLSNFNTKNVSKMTCMFFRCTKLKELNIINFDTINVKDMESMFLYCGTLEKIFVNRFVIKSDTKVHNMISNCHYRLQNTIKEQNPGLKFEAFKDINNIT
jgi:surface protein